MAKLSARSVQEGSVFDNLLICDSWDLARAQAAKHEERGVVQKAWCAVCRSSSPRNPGCGRPRPAHISTSSDGKVGDGGSAHGTEVRNARSASVRRSAPWRRSAAGKRTSDGRAWTRRGESVPGGPDLKSMWRRMRGARD